MTLEQTNHINHSYGRWRYLDLPFDKVGEVLLVLKHREGAKKVVDQPVPVSVHLLQSSSWSNTHTLSPPE